MHFLESVHRTKRSKEQVSQMALVLAPERGRLSRTLQRRHAVIQYPEQILICCPQVGDMRFLNNARAQTWKFLAPVLKGAVVLLLGTWIFLISTICSSPRVADAVTGNTIAYNCHGSIVLSLFSNIRCSYA
jgi:hypothetical protein